jgi:hypothetical protein
MKCEDPEELMVLLETTLDEIKASYEYHHLGHSFPHLKDVFHAAGDDEERHAEVLLDKLHNHLMTKCE